MWNLKKKKNKQSKTRLTKTENKLTAASGKGSGWMGEKVEEKEEVQTSSYKINKPQHEKYSQKYCDNFAW